MKHIHRGKSSESILDKDVILRELDILPGQTILDAGCGDGYMAREFSRMLKGSGRVIALDADGSAIEALKKDGRLAIVEIQKVDTPFGPPLEIRFSPEEMMEAVDLGPRATVEVGQFFYMQIFENA